MMKFSRINLFLLLLLLLLPCSVHGEAGKAAEISGMELVTAKENIDNPRWLFNGDTVNWQAGKSHMSLTFSHQDGIGSLYLIFGMPYGEYRLTNEAGQEVICGREGFLHDYVDLREAFGAAPASVTLSFGAQAPKLAEVRVFTEGEPPEDVQRWKLAPEDGVDLLVFPAHGDDEQLFFAGLLPYYAGEKAYEVQVVYSTDHHNWGSLRPHEMLNGLWAVGVRNYPAFGPFPDFLTRSEEGALTAIKPYGYDREDVLSFIVEQLRKYKPLVVVGHDLQGEYGHGFHRLYGHLTAEATDISVDPGIFPESADQYGVWDVPKTYLHLYEENPVHINWDIPLSHFDGKTAYEVTRDLGYPAHKSQYKGFVWYFTDHETAEDIVEHSPCCYGLYRSTAGEDVQKNDLFENLVSRRELKIQEQARKEEAEALRLRQEQEAVRRKEQEEKRQEADRRTLALQTAEGEKQYAQRQRLRLWALAGILSLSLLLFLFLGKNQRTK